MSFVFFTHDSNIFKGKHAFSPSDSEALAFKHRIKANSIEHLKLSATFSKPAMGPSILVCCLEIEAKIHLACLLSQEDVPFSYKQKYSLFFYNSEPSHKETESEFEEHLEANNGQVDLWELSQQYIILDAPIRPIAKSHQPKVELETNSKNESHKPFSKLKDLI